MKTKMILIAAMMSVTSTVFAKVHALNCTVGSTDKLQMVSLVADESLVEKGRAVITLANLDKAEGWKVFEKVEVQVGLQYTIDASTGEKNLVGATVDMGRSGHVAIHPIAIMGSSIYANLTASALGFNYPNGEKALCVRP